MTYEMTIPGGNDLVIIDNYTDTDEYKKEQQLIIKDNYCLVERNEIKDETSPFYGRVEEVYIRVRV